MRVLSFIGVDSQVGTTMVSQSVGELLSKEGKKVIVLFSSGNLGEDFMKVENKSLEMSIDSLLDCEDVNYDGIEHIIQFKDELGYIAGINNIENIPFFPTDFVKKVKEGLNNTVDFLIVDGGSNLNSPLTISAIMDSDENFFVMSQQEKSLRKYKYMRRILLEKYNVKVKLVLNKYMEEEGLYTKEHMEFLLEDYIDHVIKYFEGGWEKEIEKESLISNEVFLSEIGSIVNSILNRRKRNIMREESFYDEKRNDYRNYNGERKIVGKPKKKILFK